jgi:type IX secretion system substrate protein
MKQFTRLVSLFVMIVFAFSSISAQNTLMTKAQALGLKSATPVNIVANDVNQTDARAVFLEEGFDVDGDFPPTDWSQTIFNADNTWIQSNPTDNNFNTIDPNSLFSALVPYVAADQDEWIFSPVISAPNETPLALNFYAGVSGPWIANATIKCHISDDGGTTWTELWNAQDLVDPAADWAWYPIALDISAYAAGDFQVAWQYVGNDGDLAGIDGVSIEAGYEYIYQDDFEEFTVGDYLVETDQSGMWTTWSNDPGSAEDALISDAEAASPTKSVVVEGISDLVLKLGNKTSGEYIVALDYYIPSNFGGYVNLQHFEAPGNEWAVEVYFGASAGDENGYMLAGDPDEIPFTFPHDQWFDIEFVVDLDEDLASATIDGVTIVEWQFSLQAQGEPGTLQLGGVNIYAGAPTGETPMFYFDNVEYIVVDPGITNPIIGVDPTSIFVTIDEGQSTTDMFTIANTGQSELNFEIVTIYPQAGKSPAMVPAGASSPKVLNQDISADPNYTPGSGAPISRDELLHYDSDNSSAIGSNTADYEWRVAAMFPADMLNPYIGMEIDEIQVYINDAGIEYKAQVYGMGSFNTPGPGDLLIEQPFNANPMSWTTITLDSPVKIDGQDLWVGYWVSSTMEMFTPGVDAGPAVLNGDWMASGPGWSHLSSNPDLNFNWNIRANVTGTPIEQWLSADVETGSLAQDGSKDVNVTIDASGLVTETYQGKFLIRNNDPTNELAQVAVTLGVTVGINENGETEYVAAYPNPASTVLHIQSNGNITNISLINTIGQVVYNNSAASDIDVSNLERGVYFIQVDTENGTTTQKILIQ